MKILKIKLGLRSLIITFVLSIFFTSIAASTYAQTTVTIQPYDLPDHQLVYEDNIVKLQKRNQSFWKRKRFHFVEGLGDANGISIMIKTDGGPKYAKTINNTSIVWQTFSNTNAFKNAATFYLQPNFVNRDEDYVAIQSKKYSNRYIVRSPENLSLASLSNGSSLANKRKGTWRLIDSNYHEFTNPVSVHTEPDPDIVLFDGTYHLTYTSGNRIEVRTNTRLENVGHGAKVGHGPKKALWYANSVDSIGTSIWGTELRWINNRWYIYASGQKLTNDPHDPTEYKPHRQFNFVLEGTNGKRDITKAKFTFKAWLGDNGLDGSVFELNGKYYFVYSKFEPHANGSYYPAFQSIWIAEMANPHTLKASTARRIVTPQYTWENHTNGAKINEGPTLLKRGNRLLLFYSANSFMNDNYCVGLATLKVNGNVLNPNHWVKHNQPVFKRAPGIYGPGGVCFVESQDGTELWMAYHARLKPFTVDKKRVLFLHKTQWNGNFPNFGDPYIINKEKVRAPSSDDFGKITIQSYNYPSKHINHVPEGQSRIENTNSLTNRLFKQYEVYYNFNLEKSMKFGLASSENEIFLQHYAGKIYFWPIDEKPNSPLNASFYEVDGWIGNGTVSYRSKNYPNTYLRHYANKMSIEYTTNASPNLQKKDASWSSIIMDSDALSNFNKKKKIISTNLNTGLSIHPNPFTNQSIIQFYQLVTNTPVTVFITDMMGNKVASLLNNKQISSGTHQLIFDGSNLPAGMYYCTIVSGDMMKTEKVMILK